MEDIVAMRREAGVAKFLVKWTGYSTAANTWEPRENLPPSRIAEYLADRVGLGEETDDDDDNDDDDDSSESETEPGSAPPAPKRQRTTAPRNKKRSAPAPAPPRAKSVRKPPTARARG